jgi:hypothetical protein
MANSALQPVSEAIYARLNVASLKAATPTGAGCLGGVTEDPAQGVVFPFLWFEVSGRDLGGLGQELDVTQIELRLHVFSTASGLLEARRIMREAVRLLRYVTLTVTGYALPVIGRPDDEIPLPFEELNGVKVKELVTIWTSLFASEVAA